MNTDPNQLTDEQLTEIHDIIQNITNKSRAHGYVNLYRGEARIYPKVCSGLYREYINLNEKPDFDKIHDFIAEKYMIYLLRKESDAIVREKMDILAELQHFGAKTNLIDFTPDYLIALFFACDVDHEQNGRIIILKESNDEEYKIINPHRVVDRIIHQKSKFVHPSNGFLHVESYQTILIRSELKINILTYLERYHAITREYIYNDVHGFMKVEEIQSYYILLTKGIEEIRNQNYNTAIEYLECAKSLNEYYYPIFISLIQAYYKDGQYDKCIESCDEALKLQHPPAKFHSEKGKALHAIGNYEKAIECQDRALLHEDPKHEVKKAEYRLEKCKSFIKYVYKDDTISQGDSLSVITILHEFDTAIPKIKIYLDEIDQFIKDEMIKLPENVSSTLKNLKSNV